jgi:hypothetical protein
MAAPAFWYFASPEAAQAAADGFRREVIYTIEPTTVADDFELDE